MLVIPRDLFNHGNMLKCYGKIYINLENMVSNYSLNYDETGNCFDVSYTDDGETYLTDVTLSHNDTGETIFLYRPLNSRGEWPMYAMDSDDEIIPVFNDDGTFSEEFVKLLQK